MSSFRQLFTPRSRGSGSSLRETPFDRWLSFHIQSALRQKEPSPATWERIRRQLGSGQPAPRRSFRRIVTQNWPRYVSLIMQILFSEPELADRLNERKMLLFTKMMTLPGPSVPGLAVT